MKIEVLNWPVSKANHRKPKINPKPAYQRGAVWGEVNKQLLIDTILRGYDIPKFYLRVTDAATTGYEHEVVDGQQRLRAIWDFVENKFALGERSNDVPGEPPLEGKHFKDLSSDLQDDILSFTISVSEIRNGTEIEIRDLFLRLQEGKALNPAEKRNAMMGKMRDFVSDLAETHSVFPRTEIKKDRFAWDDLVAHVACLELNNGPTDIKAENLAAMYSAQTSFDPDGQQAKRIRRILGIMSRVLSVSVPEMNIKWGFVDLYLALSRLDRDFDLKNREDEIRGVYVSFEQERRDVADPAELIASGSPSASDRDLYDYIVAFQREGAKRANVEIRHKVYINRLLEGIPDLTPKDPIRAYSEDQRLIIWRRDGEQCKECGVKVLFKDMHADHVVPHTSGGTTTVDNGRCLCGPCNLKKGAALPQATPPSI